MNDVELKALELKRKAWEVLDGKADVEGLFYELYRLERQSPDFFNQVAKQLEEDNGRWAASSALPNAEVKRDANTSRIEEISFHALDASNAPTVTNASIISNSPESTLHSEHGDKTEFQHVAISKEAEDELARSTAAQSEQPTVIVWRSDFGDREWLESFAKEIKEHKNEQE